VDPEDLVDLTGVLYHVIGAGEELTQDIIELASGYGRYGYHRITVKS